jgi:hypothetical protein
MVENIRALLGVGSAHDANLSGPQAPCRSTTRGFQHPDSHGRMVSTTVVPKARSQLLRERIK